MPSVDSAGGPDAPPEGTPPVSEPKVSTSEFKVRGDNLIARVKELLHEGNVRRIIIKNDEGRTLLEIPLTLGVVGAVLAPVWAALGALAALAADLRIVVEKVEKPQS
jgi:hypothetical protein